MLHAAIAGTASIRFYGWNEATVSLGYFQPAALRNLLPFLPFVRRPTGGGMLVHDHELTYALAVPAGPTWQGDKPWMHSMHSVIAAALAEMGFPVELAEQRSSSKADLCFLQITPADVLCRGTKMVGSAQRKHRRCLLQHGAILLAGSRHTPSLPGILEQAGRLLDAEELRAVILRQFGRTTGWQLVQDWTFAETERIAELIETKYARESWNLKR
jgi:lipoate-protein ligase A